MRNKDAIGVLECMAIDMTGCMAGLSKRSPMCDVIKQRLEAINVAQDALRKQSFYEKNAGDTISQSR